MTVANICKISVDEARALVIESQFLNDAPIAGQGKKAVFNIINRLGYVQIDTIAVINRAHHHTFWTRYPNYDESILHELQSKDRKVFEYWGHAMSYLPMSDFRFYLSKMHCFRSANNKWVLHQLEKCKDLLNPVLDRIRAEGPLSASDFENNSGKKAGQWWDWKPAKSALEILFWQGKLMVHERRNFQKYYDLTERVLPEGLDTSLPGKEEITRFLVSRAVQAGGLVQDREINKYLQPATARDSEMQFTNLNSIKLELERLMELGDVVPVKIDGNNDDIYYANRKQIKQLGKISGNHSALHLLSPFDNIVIQRERLAKLFNFDYTIECYVPQPKRKFGYFVLPILMGREFIGRLDPKADRAAGTMLINSLHFEPGFKGFDEALPKLAETVHRFASFNSCTQVKLNKVSPAKLKAPLQKLIKQSL